MKIAMFSTKSYDRTYFARANREHGHDISFLEPRLLPETAPLAAGHHAVCAFVNDELSAEVFATVGSLADFVGRKLDS